MPPPPRTTSSDTKQESTYLLALPREITIQRGQKKKYLLPTSHPPTNPLTFHEQVGLIILAAVINFSQNSSNTFSSGCPLLSIRNLMLFLEAQYYSFIEDSIDSRLEVEF